MKYLILAILLFCFNFSFSQKSTQLEAPKTIIEIKDIIVAQKVKVEHKGLRNKVGDSRIKKFDKLSDLKEYIVINQISKPRRVINRNLNSFIAPKTITELKRKIQ